MSLTQVLNETDPNTSLLVFLLLTSLHQFPSTCRPCTPSKGYGCHAEGKPAQPLCSCFSGCFGTTAGCPIPRHPSQWRNHTGCYWLEHMVSSTDKAEFASRTGKGMHPLSLQILKAETFALGIKKVVTEFALIQKLARYWSAESWTGENDLPW